MESRAYWKEEEELILRDWADKSQIYELFHAKGHAIYKKKNAMYVIPVIIISTLTGTANFAQGRVPIEYQDQYVMAIGALSIIAAIVTTISQFLKISELNEAHRVAALSWGKFYRNVRTDLSKHPLDRPDPQHTLKLAKEEFNRLLEISPLVPKKIIVQFNDRFQDNDEISKPEICDHIVPTPVYQMTKDERDAMIKIIQKIADENKEKEDEQLTKFKQNFFKANNRNPTEEEIQETFAGLKDSVV
jgi:hypothetical protein